VAGPTNLDTRMIDWLKYQNLPFSIVVHKIDKIAAPKLEARKQEILKVLFVEDREIFWVSSSKGLGIPELQQNIVGHLLR
jgi:GTP-binding protein EngB required for normal cell division